MPQLQIKHTPDHEVSINALFQCLREQQSTLEDLRENFP